MFAVNLHPVPMLDKHVVEAALLVFMNEVQRLMATHADIVCALTGKWSVAVTS